MPLQYLIMVISLVILFQNGMDWFLQGESCIQGNNRNSFILIFIFYHQSEECVFKMLSPFKKALLFWRTSDMNGEAIVSAEADGRGCVLIKGHRQVILWRVIRNLLHVTYNFYLRRWWAWTQHRVLAQGPLCEGYKVDSCVTFFLQREHCENPEKANVKTSSEGCPAARWIIVLILWPKILLSS